MRRLLESRARRKELIPVQVAGAGESLHWMHPGALDAIPAPAREQVHILSPFDPLIIQRKRLRQRWNWVGRATRAHRQQVEAPGS